MYKSFPRPVSSGSIPHFWDEQPSISGDGQNSDGFGRIINSLSSLSACFEGCPMNIFIIVYMYINPPWFTKKHLKPNWKIRKIRKTQVPVPNGRDGICDRSQGGYLKKKKTKKRWFWIDFPTDQQRVLPTRSARESPQPTVCSSFRRRPLTGS